MDNSLQRFDLLSQIMGKTLQTFVDGVERTAYTKIQWDRFFEWDVMKYSTTFSAMQVDLGLIPMASFISPSSPKPKRSVQGVSLWSGQIPKIGHGFDITEEDLREHLMIIETGGTPAQEPMLDLFRNTVEKAIFGIHARLNWMAMQIMSTGSLLVTAADDPDGLPIAKIDMKVPTLNKKYAGWNNGTAAAWTGATATPLTDLQDTLDYCTGAGIPYNASAFYFTPALWLIFMRHPNVVSEVNYRMKNTVATSPVTKAEVLNYLSEMGFPPVIIVDELNGLETDGIVSNVAAWDTSNITLAPIGVVGKIKNAKPISVNGTVTRTAFAADGRIKIVEKADDSRVTQGFETECWGMPVLSAPKYIVIIDTSVVSSWT